MFTGMGAFPLTPMNENAIDKAGFVRLVVRLAVAGVNSLDVLGSMGNYAYLTRLERARIGHLAVAHAGDVAVIIGISALLTRDALAIAALCGSPATCCSARSAAPSTRA